MADPVTIQLEPYDALKILCYLREFDYSHRYAQSLAEAVDRFEAEIVKNITPEQVEEAYTQRHLHQVMGREPRKDVFIP